MKFLFSILILLFFISCEGPVRLTGRIVSQSQKQAIPDAKIELLDIPPILHFDFTKKGYVDSIFRSDSKGNFIIRSRMVGMVFGPPAFRLRVTKNGFQTTTISINKRTAKMFLKDRQAVYTITLKGN